MAPTNVACLASGKVISREQSFDRGHTQKQFRQLCRLLQMSKELSQ